MSRKNMLADMIAATAQEASQDDSIDELAMANSDNAPQNEKRVLAGSVRTMGLATDRIENESKALHEALASGEIVIELEPNLIEGSFIRDRLDSDLNENDELVQSIPQTDRKFLFWFAGTQINRTASVLRMVIEDWPLFDCSIERCERLFEH